MKIAHRMDHDKIHWNSFRFMVFDIPTSKGNYKERYQQLRMCFTSSPPPSSWNLLNLPSFQRWCTQWEESSIHSSCAIYIMWRNRSSWEDISGYHGSRRWRNHLARSLLSPAIRTFQRIPQTQGITSPSPLTVLLTKTIQKKYRDGEAKIVSQSTPLTWECEL